MIADGVMTSYSFLPDVGNIVANLLTVSDLATCHVYEDPQPKYYYFRFLKTNGRYLEVLLPILILTFSLPSP